MQSTGQHGGATRPLFGGALSCILPFSARDMSELRAIPDNQEVFGHSHTDQSLIVELLEYQGHVEGAEAARYHFEDMAVSNRAGGGASEVRAVEPLSKPELSFEECSAAWLLTGTQHVSKFNEQVQNTVTIHLGLFRVPQFSTDVLVTFNDPVFVSPLSSSALGGEGLPSAPWTLHDFMRTLRSLKLHDPGLFG